MFFSLTFKDYGNGWIAPKILGGLGIVLCLTRLFFAICTVSGSAFNFWAIGLIISIATYTIGAWMNYKTCICDYVGIYRVSKLKKYGDSIYTELWDRMPEIDRIQMNRLLESKMKLEQVAYLHYYRKNHEWPVYALF